MTPYPIRSRHPGRTSQKLGRRTARGISLRLAVASLLLSALLVPGALQETRAESSSEARSPASSQARGAEAESSVEQPKAGAPRLTVRIGTTNSSLSPEEREAVAQTFYYLSRRLPQYRIEVRNYPVANLEAALKAGEMDLFLASSGFYRRVFHRGLRDLVTMTTPTAPNPSFASGSVFFVRRDSPYRTLADLKGTRAAVSWNEGFTGYFIPLYEVRRQGFDPDAFFSDYVIGGSPMRRLLESVEAGKAEVAFARACTYEELIEEDPEFAKRFRAVGLHPAEPNDFRCLHSTSLLPNWTIVSTTLAPWQVSRDVTVALLDMPPTKTGYAWGVVSDFQRVDDLYRELRRGPYEYLRVKSFGDFVRTYWPALAGLVLVVLGLALHSWRAGVLVRKRTMELKDAMAKERAAYELAENERREKEMLEQVSVIGAMSSLITHELNAPLSAITNASRSLERWFENNPPAPFVERAVRLVRAQCEHAAEIVRHVRSYVKRREILREPVELVRIVSTVCRDQGLRHPAVRIDVELPDGELYVSADNLEIELAVANLVKNAIEVLEGEENPVVTVLLVQKGDAAQIVVRDNCTKTRPEDADLFGRRRIESTKNQGLGLGLLIVRTIVERSAGRIEAVWANPGLRIALSLPVMHPETSSATVLTEDSSGAGNPWTNPDKQDGNTSN